VENTTTFIKYKSYIISFHSFANIKGTTTE